jgi:hypothetical protein
VLQSDSLPVESTADTCPSGFAGAGEAHAAAGTATPGIPPHRSGDLFVAMATAPAGGTPLAWPSGWHEISSVLAPRGGYRTEIRRKRAGDNETTPAIFGGGDVTLARITAYHAMRVKPGVLSIGPSSGTVATPPCITTGAPGETVVLAGGGSSASLYSGYAA